MKIRPAKSYPPMPEFRRTEDSTFRPLAVAYIAPPVLFPLDGMIVRLVITVDAGFETDGASIPLWLQWLCGSRFSRPRVAAAVVHDWLYMSHLFSRKTADEIYRDIEEAVGVPAYKRAIEFRNLRWFGGSAYDGHDFADRKKALEYGSVEFKRIK